MSICTYCGGYLAKGMIPTCDCRERFEEDMKRGHFPPGLTEEAKAAFSWADWLSFRRIEYWMHTMQITPEEAQAKLRETVEIVNKNVVYQRARKAEQERVSKLKLY